MWFISKKLKVLKSYNSVCFDVDVFLKSITIFGNKYSCHLQKFPPVSSISSVGPVFINISVQIYCLVERIIIVIVVCLLFLCRETVCFSHVWAEDNFVVLVYCLSTTFSGDPGVEFRLSDFYSKVLSLRTSLALCLVFLSFFIGSFWESFVGFEYKSFIR